MNLRFPEPTTLQIVAGTLAAMFAPAEEITPSEWAAKNLVVPDGPRAGEKWNMELTPYLVEPLNFISDREPDNKAVVRKSKQTGFTTMAICACGYTADVEPCDLFLIEPTQENLSDFIGEKLQRAIDGSPALQRKILKQTSRSNKGSTTKSKRFPGGSLLMGIATSTADLRGKTRKKVIRDEASEYDDDLGGQGSPHDMIGGAYTAFLASGDWKDLWISTPVVKGVCAIDREFEAGDQRYWHIRCPGCDAEIYFKAADPDRFQFDKVYPYRARYVAECCGTVIESWQRDELVRNGIGRNERGEVIGWKATTPGPGRHRSYHFDALSSPFVPWDVIAKSIIDAADDPTRLKALYNLTFGLPYDMRGDAPEHDVLMRRRVEAKLGHIPPGALLVTIAADVQKRGIYVEVLAHTPDQQTWPIYVDYLDGPTVNVDEGAFIALTELYRREWPDAYGNRHRADEFAIDANYHTQAIYEWTRRHPGVKAIKGADGWRRVPLGVATDQDVDYGGKKIKGGAKLRLVGTWDLKSKFYEYLAREAVVQGSAIIYPPGYCHFGNYLDEDYFRQITAEYLDDEIFKGRPRKRWKQHGGDAPNHWLDCRVYNMAVADAYFQTHTADDWALRARERGIPVDLTQPDLFTPAAFCAVSLKPVEGATQASAASDFDPYAAMKQLNAGV